MTLARTATIALTLALPACATAAQSTGATAARATLAAAPQRPTPRDPHGEALRLLPPGALSWARVETGRARSSRHWAAVTAMLTNEGMMDTVRRFQRDLGVDLLAQSTVLAGAVYERLPSAQRQTFERLPQAAIVVRDGFDRATVLAALGREQRPVTERTIGAMTVYMNEQYAVSFLARDVMIAFHPALAERVQRQVEGYEHETLDEDRAWADLWQRAGARAAIARSAGRDTSAFALEGGEGAQIEVPSFERVVAWVDGEDAVSVRVVAQARDRSAASRFIASVDGLRRAYGGRFLVRMMGFGRLLNEGVVLSADDVFVRVAIDATGAEVQRVLQLAGASAALRGGG